MGSVSLFNGCARRSGGIDEAFCHSVCGVPGLNEQVCTPHECKSPWRYCLMCVKEGVGRPNPVANNRRISGLCDVHAGTSAKMGSGGRRTDAAIAVGLEEVKRRLLARQQTNGTGSALQTGAPPQTPKHVGNGVDVVDAPSTASSRHEPAVLVAPRTVEQSAQAIAVLSAPQATAVPAQQLPVISTLADEIDDEPDGPWKEIVRRVKAAIATRRYLHAVDPRSIRQMKGQPRTVFNPERLRRLRKSMEQWGQIQPITLRRLETPVLVDGFLIEWEITDGERRWRAAHEAGEEVFMLSAMVYEIDDEAAQYIIAVVANFNREEHTPLEASDAIVKMRGMEVPWPTIRRTFGKSQMWVDQRYGLRRLVPEVREMLDWELPPEQQLSIQAAIHISGKTPESQLATAQRVLRGELQVNQIRTEAIQKGEVVKLHQPKPHHITEVFTNNVGAISRQVVKVAGALRSISPSVFAATTPQKKQALLETLGKTRELIELVEEDLEKLLYPDKEKAAATAPAPPQNGAAARPLPSQQARAETHHNSGGNGASEVEVKYYERTSGGGKKLVTKRLNVVEYGKMRFSGALGWQVDQLPIPAQEEAFCRRMQIRF